MHYPRRSATGSIASLRLRNRLVHPPIVRDIAGPEGTVTSRQIALLRRTAHGRAGAIIVEATVATAGR